MIAYETIIYFYFKNKEETKMRKIKRFMSLLLALMMLTGFLAACGNKPSEQTPTGSTGTGTGDGKNSESKTLTVLVEGGSPANAVVEATKEDFEKLSGCKIIVDAVPYSGIYDKVMAEISSGTAQHDIICIDVLWFAAMKPGLRVLNDVVIDEVKNDSLPGLLDGATIDGDLLGYPLWTNCQLLIYRADLFEDPDNKAAFKAEYGYELAPPKNWEQYYDVAKFFTKGDMYGTALHGLGPHAPTQLLNFAAQAGASPLVLKEDLLTPNINEKPYVEALTYMQKMQKDGVIPPDTLAIGADECNELFVNGKIAMQLNWAHLYASSYERLGDKVGVAPNISGSAGIGAIPGPWYMSIIKNSPNQDEAIEYINYIFKNNEEFLKAGLKVSARVSDFKEYGSKLEYSHLIAMIETLGCPASQNRPNTPKWAQLEEVIINMVQNVLAGNDPQQVADKAKEAMDEIMGLK